MTEQGNKTTMEPSKSATKPKTTKKTAPAVKVSEDTGGVSYSYGNVTTAPISHIEIEEGFNARVDFGIEDGSLKELSDSIRENGLIQPIKVFHEMNPDSPNFNKLVVIDGHRRLTAIKMWEQASEEEIGFLAEIPVLIAKLAISPTERIFEMLLSGSGKPLTKLEQGIVYNKLVNVEKAFTVTELAKKLGKTHTYISDAITLSTAPEEVQESVKAGEMTPTAAISLTREQNKRGATESEIVEKAKEMVSDAKEKGKKAASVAEIKPEDKAPEKPETVAKKEAAVVSKIEKKPVSLSEIKKVLFELCDMARKVEDTEPLATDFSFLMEDLGVHFEDKLLQKSQDGIDLILLDFFNRERELDTAYVKMFTSILGAGNKKGGKK